MHLEIRKGDKIETCLKVKDIWYHQQFEFFEISTYGLTEQTNVGYNVGWYQSRFEPNMAYTSGYLGSKVKFWYNDSTGHHEEKEFDVQSEGDIRHLIQMVRIGLSMETV